MTTDIASTQDLLDRGYTRRQIRAAHDRGELTRIRRGLYAVGGDPRPKTEATALVTRLGGDVVVSHLAAALAHDLPVPEWKYDGARVSRNRSDSGDKKTGFYPCPFDEDEVVVIDGLRTTSLPRTVIDLARHVPLQWAVAAADVALARGVTREVLEAAVDRHPRRPGNANARKAIAMADGRSESVGESRSRVIMATHGIPAPELQIEIVDRHQQFVGRVDFLWDDVGLIGEFDGDGKYLLDPELRAREEERQRRLEELGWVVIRWTWEDLANPDALAHKIAVARRQASGRRRARGRLDRPHLVW